MCCVMISSHVRPGRPPKRVLPFPAPSPQDAMLQLNRSPLVTQDNFSRWVSIKLICVSNTDPSTSSGRLEVIPWMEDGSPGLLEEAPSPEVTPWRPLGPPTWCLSITPLLCCPGQVMWHVTCADLSWWPLQECCPVCLGAWGPYLVCLPCTGARATPSWRLTSSSTGTSWSTSRGKSSPHHQ